MKAQTQLKQRPLVIVDKKMAKDGDQEMDESIDSCENDAQDRSQVQGSCENDAQDKSQVQGSFIFHLFL